MGLRHLWVVLFLQHYWCPVTLASDRWELLCQTAKSKGLSMPNEWTCNQMFWQSKAEWDKWVEWTEAESKKPVSPLCNNHGKFHVTHSTWWDAYTDWSCTCSHPYVGVTCKETLCSSWSKFQGCCYKLITDGKSWTSASSYCRTQGATLATIKSSAEQQFIETIINRGRGTWIGLNDRSKEGAFVWEDGSPISWKHWEHGEPNNADGKEDCVQLTSKTFGGWNDVDCSGQKDFLCEKVFCPDRSSHEPNGTFHCSGRVDHEYGSTCAFTCDDGYKQYGHQSMQCRITGQWNTEVPICRESCHWKRSHCWPGTCTDQLPASCVCQYGFKRRTGTAARCELDTAPDLSTCRVAVTDSRGTSTNSSYTGNLQNCQNQRDEWMNTVPVQLFFVIKAGLNITLIKPPHGYYVNRSLVGVIQSEITVVKKTASGSEEHIQNHILTDPPYCQDSVSPSNPKAFGVEHDCEATLNINSLTLDDGDSLCADMGASGGGFYNLIIQYGVREEPVFYTPTQTNKRVCFIYDNTPPAHCSTQSGASCNTQPMTLSTRVSRYPEVEVLVDRWIDPRPPAGANNPGSSSGISRYRLDVHGVDVGLKTLVVQDDAVAGLTLEWESNSTDPGGPYQKIVKLPEEEKSKLFALLLEVHDWAGNVAYARRLVMVDNSSSVQLRPSRSLRVVHANPQSSNKWQTDQAQKLCVNWTERFYNTELIHNNWLMKVEVDAGRGIHGNYDQTSGILPVNGTDNVDGVVQFQLSWSRDHSSRTPFTRVSDVFAQNLCLHEPLADGETYDLWIRANDVMNNSEVDNVWVSIDYSGPEVTVMGLRGRWDRDGLYVHNSTDLSSMRLVLRAADPHSGLLSLRWTLGTRPLADDVGQGTVGVQRKVNQTSCGDEDHCYCPAVGDCEIHQYVVTFGNLVHHNTHQGDHHREYYFTITATNQATLHTTEALDILLDESPPTVGVVWEGLGQDGQAEMDFTSSDLVHVRWHGYQDHESGILMYRVMLDQLCLTAQEMDHAQNATDVEHGTETSFRLSTTGMYFSSVVAYNGAMQPSLVACSDGIVFDTSPPAILNFSLIHARSGRMVGCAGDNRAWLVNTNLTKVALANVSECSSVCSSKASLVDIHHLPVSSLHVIDEELSEHYCRKLPTFREDSVLVLPSDYVLVTWQGDDEESDMEEYYMGMGSHPSTSSSPDLLPFTPTHGHPSYHARHAGMSHADQFYVFLRAVNKVGLTTSLTSGPYLIDVTPPDVTHPLTARVEDGYLLVTWNEETFKDAEQPVGVKLEVLFRVGYDNAFVTPFLERPETLPSQCLKTNVTGCAHYPVTALFAHDTLVGRSFFFQIHIINAAGHVTSVNTSSVPLPAHYPPSHAVVLDVTKTMVMEESKMTSVDHFIGDAETNFTGLTSSVTLGFQLSEAQSTTSTYNDSITDPESPHLVAEFSDDVDVILQREEVCVVWSGFYHQEEVHIIAGLGSAPGLHDIVPFQAASNESFVCINVTSVPLYSKIFSVVKATSSGGTAVFSSDGFVMIPKNDTGNQLQVFNGNECLKVNMTEHYLNDSVRKIFLSEIVKPTVHPADFLFIVFTPFVSGVTFDGAIVLHETLTGYQIVTSSSNVSVVFPVITANNYALQVLHCMKFPVVLPSTLNHVTVTWEMIGPIAPFVNYLALQIMDKSCVEESAKKTKYVHQHCLLHEQKVDPLKGGIRVYTEHIIFNHLYVASLSACVDDGCLPVVYSNPILFLQAVSAAVDFQHATVLGVSSDVLHIDVKVAVEAAFILPQKTDCIYRWAVVTDKSGSFPITEWTVSSSSNCSDIEINGEVKHSSNAKGTLYACLKTIYPWRSQKLHCSQMARSPNSPDLASIHVVELAYSTLRSSDLQPFLQSQQLGTRLQQLYDLDIDFAKSDVMISAVVTGCWGQNVTWYLTNERRVPSSGRCAENAECLASSLTYNSQVVFPRQVARLQDRQLYFVCARMEAGSAETDFCGDGVVIDDAPPLPGSVAIGNANGHYLAHNGQVLVTWSIFFDVEAYISSLPDDLTVNYSVALGSYPASEDLAPFVPVGQRTNLLFSHISLPSAASLYATVRAEDRVGHVTETSSDLVIVDSSPPWVGLVSAGSQSGELYVHGPDLSVFWTQVHDTESGVSMLEVGVAKNRGGDSVIDFQKYDEMPAIFTDTRSLVEGHSYVALLKVTNGAGLVSVGTSIPFVFDSSPPSPGHVWHVDSNTSTSSGYSREVGVLRVKWAGFSDPHSGLQYYRAGLGSSPGETDVVPFVYVGLQTEYVWRLEFSQGRPYFAVLEACNRAGLCRVTSSSRVVFDHSPPISGHVIVGSFGHHNKFIGHNTSVPVQWRGFSDPQTGIQHFTWCVGSAPRLCDVKPEAHAMLSYAAHGAGLALPEATPLYVTVTAWNPAGLSAVSVSDSFVVDSTAPDVITRPHFLSLRTGDASTGQWDRSLLRLAWLFRDPGSSLVSHTVNIRSRLTGRLVLEPILLGDEPQLTVTLDQASLLADGDSHWFSVSACNAAHLCVMATSDVIMIDSTPPVAGTFLSPLTWTSQQTSNSSDVITTIDVKWKDFTDSESGMAEYELIAGRGYNGEEISEGRVRVQHNSASLTQSYSLKVDQPLRAGDVLHLAVLGKNSLQFPSSLVRMEFRSLFHNPNGSSGTLMLIRHSCQAAYCTNECTCAATGQLCEGPASSCQQLEPSHPAATKVQVVAFMGVPPVNRNGSSLVSSPMYLTSAKCLEGYWALVDPESMANVSRFEFSFSLANKSAGEGVFNAQKESVWYDVGRHVTAVHCMPANNTLLSGQSYMLHVRVWLSRDSYVSFTSSSIKVDHSPPQIRRSRAVTESYASCSKDIDYVTNEISEVTACWGGVFADSQSGLARYQVWMGTSPFASNHIQAVEVGDNTSHTFPTMHLEAGTRYYVTVRAWNEAGLQTTAVSDGFLVDVAAPVAGVVLTSSQHGSHHAQASASHLSASWHGFHDAHSGVSSYHVTVYDTSNMSQPLLPFSHVGFKTEVSLRNLELTHHHSYVVAVKAKDAAGLESLVAKSSPILIDLTPPEGVTCTNFTLEEETTLFQQTLPPSIHLERYSADLRMQVSHAGEVIRLEVIAELLTHSTMSYLHVAEFKMPLYFRFSQHGGAVAQHDFLSPYTGDMTLQVVVDAPQKTSIAAKLYRCSNTETLTQNSVTIHQINQHEITVCSRVRDQESGIRTMKVGVGSTEGGLQVHPWTLVGESGHVRLNVHVQHALPLHATVVSENHAGQWTRFFSQPIVFDRTGPEISEVKLKLNYMENITVVASWRVEDSHSGVESCSCELRGHPTIQSAVQLLRHVIEARCQWQVPDARHGEKVQVHVSCVNGVQIQSSRISLPETFLLRAPDLAQVVGVFAPNNPMTSPYQRASPKVRSSLSPLELFWRGGQDPTASLFYIRFLSQLGHQAEWCPLESYKTAAIVDRVDGHSVTAQLKTTNARNLTSEVVDWTVTLDDSAPGLTGHHAKANLLDGQLFLDWSNVFQANRELTFSIFAGSAQGYGDVINHVTTTSRHCSAVWSTPLSELHVLIKAVYDDGVSNVYKSLLHL